MVQLGLGNHPRHEQPDSPVLLHLDAPQVPLRLADPLLQISAVLGAERLDAGDDQFRVLDHPLHLPPYRFLQPFGSDVRALPAFEAETLHTVALVVTAWCGQIE